jgi:cytoplasmic iron level regulating protein YaaA (DUF328/UPF0246 family)
VSAVAGLVALADPLPYHRLKLSGSLPPLGRLATFWRPRLSEVLNDHLAGRLVVDLLPREHAAAWTPDPDRYDLRRVTLLDGRGRAAGHDAKAAKGRLARDLLSSEDPGTTLAHWTDPHFVVVVDVCGPSGRAREGGSSARPARRSAGAA